MNDHEVHNVQLTQFEYNSTFSLIDILKQGVYIRRRFIFNGVVSIRTECEVLSQNQVNIELFRMALGELRTSWSVGDDVPWMSLPRRYQ